MSRISISYKDTGVDVITIAGRTRLGRVQSANVSANLPATVVQELGSDKQVGRIFDLPEVTVAISTIDVGARNAFALAGRNWATAASGSYVEAQDIKYVCLAQTFKSATNDDIARTLYIPGARLDSLSLNYSVGGDGTEEYNFQALDRRWLRNDVDTVTGTVTGGTISLPSGVLPLKNGSHVLSIFVSGEGYVANDVITATTSTTVTFDTTKVPNSSNVLLTVHRDLTDQWDYTYQYPNVAPDYTPAPDQPVGMRGYNVEVFLTKATVSGQRERVLRGQTVSLQAQYPTTKINELGSEQAVGYSDQIPEITGTLEVMQHDFKLLEQFSGDDAGAENNYSAEELNDGTWGLEVRLWRRGADKVNGSPEKTVYVSRLEITQDANNSQVGQDVMLTFNIASRDGKMYMFKGRRPESFTGL